MLDVEEQLSRYGEAIEARFLEDRAEPMVPVARPGMRSRRRLVVGGVSLLVAVAVIVVLAARTVDDGSRVIIQPATPGLFSSRTGVVLVFNDGLDGVTAVDLDRRVAAHDAMDGDRAGDQPFRDGLTGDHVVVGWGQIFADPLDGGPSRKIDDATIFVPAAEPGEVWTQTWGTGGASGGVVRRVNMQGTVTSASAILEPGWYPVLGVPGGLVVESASGIAIWDAASGAIGPVLGPGPASSVASDGRSLAWCNDPCATTHLAVLPRSGPPTAPYIAPGLRLAFSPDGRDLATLRQGAAGASLVLTQVATGVQSTVAQGLSPQGSVRWTDDGQQLFYTDTSYDGDTSRLGRYDRPTGSWELRTVPMRLGFGVLALAASPARQSFDDKLADVGVCRAAGLEVPSDRDAFCFHF